MEVLVILQINFLVKKVLGKLTSFITGKGMRSGAQTKGITRLMNAFRGGGMRGGGKALMRMGGGTLAKAASAATSVGMTGKGLYDFF